MIDYKIAASIINCFYTKLASDGENAQQIAKDMKMKISNSKNNKHIEKHLNDFKKSSFEIIDGKDLDDFPILDIELIKNKIIFGSYQ